MVPVPAVVALVIAVTFTAILAISGGKLICAAAAELPELLELLELDELELDEDELELLELDDDELELLELDDELELEVDERDGGKDELELDERFAEASSSTTRRCFPSKVLGTCDGSVVSSAPLTTSSV